MTNVGTVPIDLAVVLHGDHGIRGSNNPQAPPGTQVAPSQTKVIVLNVMGGGETDVEDASAAVWGPNVDPLFAGGPGLDVNGGTIGLRNTLDEVMFDAVDTDRGRSLVTLEVLNGQVCHSREV